MDISKFDPKKMPGRLFRLAEPINDYAFVPNELPPQWKFSEKLWPVLCDAHRAVGELNGIGQTLSNPQLLLRPLQNREAITSSKIEGTFVTPEQLLLYQMDPKEPKVGDEKMSDWLEVFNYSHALKKGCAMLWSDSMPICNRVIKEMHKVLLNSHRDKDKLPGEFRNGHVQIGAAARFIPPPKIHVEELMSNLEKFINDYDQHKIDPIVFSYIVHYQLETIHPFKDGNGRIGRALLSLMLCSFLGHSMPWLYMSAYFEKYKDEYVSRLFQVSSQNDWEGWIEFCLLGTIAQAKDSIRRCFRFNKIREEFLGRVGNNGTSRTHKIIEKLFENPIVTIPEIAKLCSCTYPTAKKDVEFLLGLKILHEVSENTQRLFYCSELIKVAYLDSEIKESSGSQKPDTVVGNNNVVSQAVADFS